MPRHSHEVDAGRSAQGKPGQQEVAPIPEAKGTGTRPRSAPSADPVLATAGPGVRLLGLRGAPLLLASQSPRRRELLERLQIPLIVLPVEVPENNRAPEESPAAYVLRLARSKAEAVSEQAIELGAYAGLGADTVVDLEGDVLEKPSSRSEAARLLERLGGRWHRVWTGLALIRLRDRKMVTGSESSRVYFAVLEPEERELYLDTGEPMDKAGAYGIQGFGGLFVPRIEGDYFNVMGLPLARLRQLCHELEEKAGSVHRGGP